MALNDVFTTTPFIKNISRYFHLLMGGSGYLVDFIYQLKGEALHGYVGAGPYAFSDEPLKIGFMEEIGCDHQFRNVSLIIDLDWHLAVQIFSTMELPFNL